MTLPETYEVVSPAVIAFISKVRPSAPGQPPLFPLIFGTGFCVHPDGIVATNRHVIDVFPSLGRHPTTGESNLGAMLFIKGKTETGKAYQRLSVVDVKDSTVLESFEAQSKWFGEAIPDLGFVQLNVKQVPFLDLAKQEFTLKPGMSIATVGFPMGDTPLTLFDKVNQMTPFVRRGIVSSVFPFSIAQPHGFTMDIMQQGGSSGSPVFREDSAVVVGMMASSVVDFVRAQGDGVLFQIPQNTNLSVAVAASVIRSGLESFSSKYPWKTDGVPTLEDLLAKRPMREETVWKPFGFSPSQ